MYFLIRLQALRVYESDTMFGCVLTFPFTKVLSYGSTPWCSSLMDSLSSLSNLDYSHSHLMILWSGIHFPSGDFSKSPFPSSIFDLYNSPDQVLQYNDFSLDCGTWMAQRLSGIFGALPFGFPIFWCKCPCRLGRRAYIARDNRIFVNRGQASHQLTQGLDYLDSYTHILGVLADLLLITWRICQPLGMPLPGLDIPSPCQ